VKPPSVLARAVGSSVDTGDVGDVLQHVTEPLLATREDPVAFNSF
jgi:hypothetical protein